MPPKPAYFYLYASSGATFEFLRQSLQPYQALNIHTKCITHTQIKAGILQENSDQILGMFLPGNQSGQLYLDDCGIEGLNGIKDYISSGGTFTGICAGGYISSKTIQYKSANKTITKTSNLDLFNGTASGQLPLLQSVDGKPEGWQLANVTSVNFTTDGGNTVYQADTLYWGGGEYIPAEGENIDVLARFNALPNQPIAMAARDYGIGRIVFSGIHPEISGSILYPNRSAQGIDHDDGSFRQMLADILHAAEPNRLLLFQTMIAENFKTKRGREYIHQLTDTDRNILPILQSMNLAA